MKFQAVFEKVMNEMAKPGNFMVNRTYYHGTPSLEYAIEIFKNGFKPGDMERRSVTVPMQNTVYFTDNVGFAMVYALAPVAYDYGQSDASKYGIVFEIPGSELVDVYPDEYNMHHILYGLFSIYVNKVPVSDMKIASTNREFPAKQMKWLYELSRKTIGDGGIRFLLDNYGTDSSEDEQTMLDLSKELIRFMSDQQRLQVMELFNTDIAHRKYRIRPSIGWLVRKADAKKYRKDGGNFFDIARKVTRADVEKLAGKHGYVAPQKNSDMDMNIDGAIAKGDYEHVNEIFEHAIDLLQEGADAETVNRMGGNAGGLFIWACMHDRVDLVKEFIKAGLNIDVRDRIQNTPLIISSATNDGIDMAKILLDAGADVDARGENNQTALMIASLHGNDNIVRFLLDRGADAGARDKFGWTPLMFAKSGKKRNTVEILKQHMTR